MSTLSHIFSPVLALKDHPVLVRWKNIYIVTGGIITSVAVVFSYLLAMYYARTMFPAETAGKYWVWALAAAPLSSLLFSKLFHFFALGADFFQNPMKHLSETAFYNQGGQFGLGIGTVWFSFATGINFFACMDIILVSGCLALAFGRIGCYCYGCCHGRQTSSRFATVYTNPDSKVLRIFPELSNVPLVPTQLISAAYVFALFFIMIWALGQSPRAGLVSALTIIAYNFFRIVIERYRISVVNISEKKDNMRLFIKVASALSGIGIAYFIVVLLVSTQRLSFVTPQTLGEFISEDLVQPQVLAATAVIFLAYAISWGVHYKKLGQHFAWEKA